MFLEGAISMCFKHIFHGGIASVCKVASSGCF